MGSSRLVLTFAFEGSSFNNVKILTERVSHWGAHRVIITSSFLLSTFDLEGRVCKQPLYEILFSFSITRNLYLSTASKAFEKSNPKPDLTIPFTSFSLEMKYLWASTSESSSIRDKGSFLRLHCIANYFSFSSNFRCSLIFLLPCCSEEFSMWCMYLRRSGCSYHICSQFFAIFLQSPIHDPSLHWKFPDFCH